MTKEIRRVIETWTRTEDVRHIAVMPDVHLAEFLCIGCVIASRNLVFPTAIGSDIGCGMTAVRFSGAADLPSRVLENLYEKVPANRHSRRALSAGKTDSGIPLSSPELERLAREDGHLQLGTLGTGNHFIELQADEQNNLWLMLHSGSRGIGQAISRFHAEKARRTETGIPFFEPDSPEGKAFLQDELWGVEYARRNRRAMVDIVAEILDELFGIHPEEETLIDCPHNFVRRETNKGESLWVHRKGAISAAAGEPGVIPGSMGTMSFHVSGRGCEDALCSASHGAGRAMSRTEARMKIRSADLVKSMESVWFDHRKSRSLVDEAPAAYKDITKVMRAQRDLVRIERRLRPLLNWKG